jgi:hypothetical protein
LTLFTELLGNQLAFAIETLPDITVIAPRKPLEEQINNSLKLDEDDIAIAHERTITDVIHGMPGITATKVGGFGQPSGLYIRGVGGQGVVTLDGIPLLQSLPGLLFLDTLPAEAIQSAEIVRGPDSAYRAFQSLGGGIRLTTQDRQNTGGKLSVEGGSFGLLRETAAPRPIEGLSDYAAFIDDGTIPFGAMTSGFGKHGGQLADKTVAEASIYGGTAGQPYDPCASPACDTVSNISEDMLGLMSGAAANAIVTLANDPILPTR